MSNTVLIRFAEVQKRVGLSRTHLYNLVKKGTFPAPVKIIPGGRASAWRDADIEAFLEQRFSTIKG